jgi:hypothetical protein
MEAKLAADAAIDPQRDLRKVFTDVGCDWGDALAASHGRATAMMRELHHETASLTRIGAKVVPLRAAPSWTLSVADRWGMEKSELFARLRSTWLKGLFAGLLLTNTRGSAWVNHVWLKPRETPSIAGLDTFAERLDGLEINVDIAEPFSAEAVYESLNNGSLVAVHDRALASTWLDGLMQALFARSDRHRAKSLRRLEIVSPRSRSRAPTLTT